MLSTIITTAIAFAGLSAAQSTVSLFIPDADTQPLVASIIGSDTLATTYAIECVPGTDSSDCGFPGGFILTEGPSTVAYTLSMGYTSDGSSILAFTGYYDCSLDGTTAGVCTQSFGGEEANDPGMSTSTLSATDISYMPVRITAGALASNTGGSVVSSSSSSSSSSSPAPATTKSAATASSTSAVKSSSGTGSAATQSQSSSTGVSTSASKGAAQAMVTQKAGLVFGAAAAAFALI